MLNSQIYEFSSDKVLKDISSMLFIESLNLVVIAFEGNILAMYSLVDKNVKFVTAARHWVEFSSLYYDSINEQIIVYGGSYFKCFDLNLNLKYERQAADLGGINSICKNGNNNDLYTTTSKTLKQWKLNTYGHYYYHPNPQLEAIQICEIYYIGGERIIGRYFYENIFILNLRDCSTVPILSIPEGVYPKTFFAGGKYFVSLSNKLYILRAQVELRFELLYTATAEINCFCITSDFKFLFFVTNFTILNICHLPSHSIWLQRVFSVRILELTFSERGTVLLLRFLQQTYFQVIYLTNILSCLPCSRDFTLFNICIKQIRENMAENFSEQTIEQLPLPLNLRSTLSLQIVNEAACKIKF